MGLITFLIVAPLAGAAAVFFISEKQWRRTFAGGFTFFMGVAALIFCGQNFGVKGTVFSMGGIWPWTLAAAGIATAAVVLVQAVRKRKWLILILGAVQLFFFSRSLWTGLFIEVKHTFFVDRLSLIVVLLVSFIGSLLCSRILKDQKEKRPVAASSGYVLISAVIGAALCDDLTLLPFLLSMVGLASCLAAGSGSDTEHGGFHILTGTLAASALMQLALPKLAEYYQTISLQRLVVLGSAGISVIFPLVLLTVAGLILASQMPFSNWLHRSFMRSEATAALVRCVAIPLFGAYFILRMSPALGGTEAGILAAAGGGFTLFCSALSQLRERSAESMSAAVLGGVTLLGALGTVETLWAGILLLFFYGLCVPLIFCSHGKNGNWARMGEGMLLLALVCVTLVKQPVFAALLHLGYLLPFFVILLSVSILWCAFLLAGSKREVEDTPVWRELNVIGIFTIISFFSIPLLSSSAVSYAVSHFSGVSAEFSALAQGDILTAFLLGGSAVLFKTADWSENSVLGDRLCQRGEMGRSIQYADQTGMLIMSGGIGMVLAMLWGGVL